MTRVNVAAGAAALCLAAVAGVFIGTVADLAFIAAIGLASLAPLFSHVRWVGWRHAITQPTPATMIVLFYLATFPQRALVVVLDGYDNVLFTPFPVTFQETLLTLMLGAAATTALVEAFHFASRRSVPRDSRETSDPRMDGRVVALALMLQSVSLLALFVLVRENGGIAGTISVFSSHDKESFAAARSLALSFWASFSLPSLWAAGAVVVRRTVTNPTKGGVLVLAGVIIAAQIVLFGSRLQVLLGLVGIWAIWFYAGRRIAPAVVVGALIALVAVSIPILNSRSGGQDLRVPAHARYSTLVGYSIFDISLAIRQRPGTVRRELEDPERWSTLPVFLVPFWPNRPDLTPLRGDAIAAREFGAPNQQNSGFPSTFITEAWLLAGWPGALIWAAIVGAALGALHRRLVGRGPPSPASLLWYAYVVTAGFNYYKDGDTFGSIIGDWRIAMYLGVSMIVCGVWDPLRFTKRSGGMRSIVTSPAAIPGAEGSTAGH